MIVLYVLPLLFLMAAGLWGAAVLLFGIYSTWQVSHDVAGLGVRPAPRTHLAAPVVLPRVVRPPHETIFATSRSLPYIATALALLMWATFLFIVYTR